MDIKRLMDEADARTVAEFLGMQIVKKGKYDFIQCPGHEKRLGKPDSHIGNAVLLKNGYKCFACNTFIPTAEMVMEYTGCNRQEAYHIIAEAMGGEEFYPDEGKAAPDLPKLRLTPEELKALKLTSPFAVSIAYRMTGDGKVTIKAGLYELYKSDKGAYYHIIHDRAREMFEKYVYIRDNYAQPDSLNAYKVYDLLGPAFDRSVYAKVTGELNKRIEICERILSILQK